MVFGARVRLLGRSVGRQPIRHDLGRIFARAASLPLGVGIDDTQSGAKLFRSTPETEATVRTRWTLDIEILARLIAARRRTGGPWIEEVTYEYTMHQWPVAVGLGLNPLDALESLLGLGAIRWTYHRTVGPRRRQPATPIAARPAPGPRSDRWV